MPRQPKKFYVIGGKYFDRVNGNTYHKAKIMDSDGRVVAYSRYQYGYGNQYMVSAEETMREKFPRRKFRLINMGESKGLKKRDVKNGWF